MKKEREPITLVKEYSGYTIYRDTTPNMPGNYFVKYGGGYLNKNGKVYSSAIDGWFQNLTEIYRLLNKIGIKVNIPLTVGGE